MPEHQPKFYLTTPIYYVNARPHIGHAYTTIVADVLARRHRLLGEDTFFLTGTDEHGQKIERSAAAAGIPPQQFADGVSAQFQSLWDRMGLTYNTYIRTTDPTHKQGVQKLFTELYDRGFIYLSTYTGSYCVSDEAFVDQPAGTPCPDCGRILETVTEENFFFKLSEFQLPLLNLIESNKLRITPESARNEVHAFLTGNVRDLLKQHGAAQLAERGDGSGLILHIPEELFGSGHLARTQAGMPYLPNALKDLSVSRSSFTWGIPVPEEIQKDAKATQPHVIYVWLDALANYITAIGYGSDDPERQAEFNKYWPADLHLVGKEITRFHCVYWPAFLLALNPKLQHDPKEQPPVLSPQEHAEWAQNWIPRQITANGWLLFDNAKMSKSRGNVVRTETILDAFGALCPPVHIGAENGKGTASAVLPATAPESASAAEVRPPTPHERDLFAADVLRYYLLREIPFGQDGSFTFEALYERYNAELTNGYGNVTSRLRMIPQNFPDGLPVPNEPWICLGFDFGGGGPREKYSSTQAVVDLFTTLPDLFQKHLSNYQFNIAIWEVVFAIGTVDSYLSANSPWLLARSSNPDSKKRLVEILYTAAEALRIATALLYPILPFATACVWAQLGLGDIEQAAANGELNSLQWGGLKPGTKLGPLAPIFPRADKGLAQLMTDMEESRNTPQPATTDPAAPPRTSGLDEPVLTVGGSTAEKPNLPTTPGPHTTAPASGPFAAEAAQNQHITIDDFLKVELRVAQILVAERIPKADKLLRLEVDLGSERRQILSGIAEWYTPEDLIGRRIVVVSNLAPRRMRGLESHGMLLAASEGEGGKPILATFGEDIALGSRVR